MNALVLSSLLLLAAAPAKVKTKGAPAPAQRELVRRTIAVTDGTREIEVHVAAGNATTLAFPLPVKKRLLADSKGYFPAESQVLGGQAFILLPAQDVPAGEAVTLQITLADGTLLPPFLLTSVAGVTDLFVDITVDLQKKASADSATGLKVQLGEMQSRLDECQQSGGDKGAVKVAELVLRQDFRKPVAFVVEKHPSRELDKQSRLLVETHHVYRLFDVSYLVLTVENRDPEKHWVLERAEMSIAGDSSAADARVLDVAQEMSQGIPPGEEAKLVVAFKTPEQGVDHHFTLKLFEKAGNRHVTLTDLKL